MRNLTLAAVASFLFFGGVCLSEQFPAQPFNNFFPGASPQILYFLNEGEGTYARDSMGNSEGALTNGPVWVNERHGHGLYFNSSGNRVIITPETVLDFIDVASTFTIMMAYRSQPQPNGFMFGKADSFSSASGWFCRCWTVTGEDVSFEVRQGGSLNKIYTPRIPVDKTGRNVPRTIIWDYSAQSNSYGIANMRIFVDGRSYPLTLEINGAGNLTNSFTNNDKPTIQSLFSGVQASFAGSVDMAGVWRRDGKPNLTTAHARAAHLFVMGTLN